MSVRREQVTDCKLQQCISCGTSNVGYIYWSRDTNLLADLADL